MKFILVSGALLCLTWISLVNAIHGPPSNCCLVWSKTKIPLEWVANYTIQGDGVCPIKAIMIKTIRNKTICSSPDDPWAIRAMKKVDMATRALLQPILSEEDGSAEAITPSAAAKDSKGSKQKKNRNGQQRQRGNRKGQRKAQ